MQKAMAGIINVFRLIHSVAAKRFCGGFLGMLALHCHQRNNPDAPLNAALNKELNEGKLCLESKKYKKAMRYFTKILSVNPDHCEALFELGKVYYMQKQYRAAIEYFSRLGEYNTRHKYASLLLGKAYRNVGDENQALMHFTKGIDTHLTDIDVRAEARYEMGSILVERGDYEKGRDVLSVLVEHDNKNPEAYMLLSRAYKHLGLYEKALAALDMSVTANRGGTHAVVHGINKNDILRAWLRAIRRKNSVGSFASSLDEINRISPHVTKSDLRIKNAILNEKEIAEGKTALQSKMRYLSIVLTNRCNLRCLMCEQEKTRTIELSHKTINEIRSLFPYLEELSWSGGEVFLYPGFMDILAEAGEHGVKQTIVTNALLLNEDIIHKLIQYKVNLVISIDATTKEKYEQIRQGARFSVLLRNIQLLNDARKNNPSTFEITLSAVIFKLNYDQIELFPDFASQYGFNNISMNFVFKSKEHDIFNINYDHDLVVQVIASNERAREKSKQKGIHYFSNISEDLDKSSRNREAACGPHVFQGTLPTKPLGPANSTSYPLRINKDTPSYKGVSPSSNASAIGELKRNKEKSICVAPWQNIAINFYGEFIPNGHCICANATGNSNEHSIHDLWNGEQIVQYRKEILQGRIDNRCVIKTLYGHRPLEIMNYR